MADGAPFQVSATSCLMPGQKKRWSSRAAVLCLPTCPAMGELCTILKAVSLYWQGRTIWEISSVWLGGVQVLVRICWSYWNSECSSSALFWQIAKVLSVCWASVSWVRPPSRGIGSPQYLGGLGGLGGGEPRAVESLLLDESALGVMGRLRFCLRRLGLGGGVVESEDGGGESDSVEEGHSE